MLAVEPRDATLSPEGRRPLGDKWEQLGDKWEQLGSPSPPRRSQTPRAGAGDQVSSSNLYCSSLGCSRLDRPWPTGPQGTSYPPFPGRVPGGGRLAPWPSPKRSWKGPRGPVWQQRNRQHGEGRKGEREGAGTKAPEGGASKALMQGPGGLTALAAASCRLSPGLAAPGSGRHLPRALRWQRPLGFLKAESSSEGCALVGGGSGPGALTSCPAGAA